MVCDRCDAFVARKHSEDWVSKLRRSLRGLRGPRVLLPGERVQARDARGRFARA